MVFVFFSFGWHALVGGLIYMGVGSTAHETPDTTRAPTTERDERETERDERIPLEQLIASAYVRAGAPPPISVPRDVSELSTGEWILQGEFHQLAMRTKAAQEPALQAYRYFRDGVRRVLARRRSALERVNLLRESVHEAFGRAFCGGRSHLAEILVDRCGNQEALARLHLALASDLTGPSGLTSLGEFRLGIRIDLDQVSAVYYAADSRLSADLATGLVSRPSASPILSPDALYYAFIRFHQRPRPFDEARLTLKPAQGPPVWPNLYYDVIGQVVPRPLSSNLRFPDVGRACFFEPAAEPARINSYCARPPERAERLFRSFFQHAGDTDPSLYQHLSTEPVSESSLRTSAFRLASALGGGLAQPAPDQGLFIRPGTGLLLEENNQEPSEQGESGMPGMPRSGSSGESRSSTSRGRSAFERAWGSEGESQGANRAEGSRSGSPAGGEHGSDSNRDPGQNFGLERWDEGGQRSRQDLARNYDPLRYGVLRPMFPGMQQELDSHMTGLPESAFNVPHEERIPETRTYLDSLAIDDQQTVLAPIRGAQLEDRPARISENPWRDRVLARAYTKLGFFLETRFTWTSDWLNRVRNIEGQKLFAYQGLWPGGPAFIEPLKLFLFTKDPVVLGRLQTIPSRNQDAFNQFMSRVFFRPENLRAPEGLLEFLESPAQAVDRFESHRVVDEIERFVAIKNILDHWRETKLLRLLDRYGSPAERFYVDFYRLNRAFFQRYARWLKSVDRDPMAFYRAIDRLDQAQRREAFDIATALSQAWTTPFAFVEGGGLETGYLEIEASEWRTLRGLWPRPFFSVFRALTEAAHWTRRAEESASAAVAVEIVPASPDATPPPPPEPSAEPPGAVARPGLLLSPATLWFFTLAQSPWLTLNHGELQKAFLEKLTPEFQTGIEISRSANTLESARLAARMLFRDRLSLASYPVAATDESDGLVSRIPPFLASALAMRTGASVEELRADVSGALTVGDVKSLETLPDDAAPTVRFGHSLLAFGYVPGREGGPAASVDIVRDACDRPIRVRALSVGARTEIAIAELVDLERGDRSSCAP